MDSFLYAAFKKLCSSLMRVSIFLPGFALVMTSFFACAFEEAERKPAKPLITSWPLPPAEPKIQFMGELSSIEDMRIESRSGLLDFLIGGEDDAAGGMIRPYGVAAGFDGRIYVTAVGKVFIFDKKNKSLSFIGDQSGKGQLKMPIGIAVSPERKIYVSDVSYERIFIYNSDGAFSGAIGFTGELKGPGGLALDPIRRRLYVANTKKSAVRSYTLEGKFLFSIGETDEIKLSYPTNITVDSQGNIYVVETGNFRAQVFDPEGKFLRIIKGVKPNNLIRPKGIAIDSEGHIYIVDSALQKVFMFDRDGNFILSFGEGGNRPGQFSVPAGIATDAEDRIYVVDQLNMRVQVFQYLGEKWKSVQQQKTPVTK